MKTTITQTQLKEVLKYNEKTGVFNWKKRSGKKAGNKSDTGYIRIRINNVSYKAHRLAWLYKYGEFPKEQIDHINHIGIDNRIVNLRVVNNRINSLNHSMNKNNTSGFCGVHWCKTYKRWVAGITINYKRLALGTFINVEEAIIARKKAEKYYGFHKNHGKKFDK